MNRSKQMALSGILAALSAVLLYLGSVIWLFAYVSPLLCSFIIGMLKRTGGAKNALICFLAVSLLGTVLMPDKETGLIYCCFFGYYPLTKESIEKIQSKILCVLTKFALFNVALVTVQLALTYLFGIPFDNPLGRWGIILLLAGGNLVFALYEVLYCRLMRLYVTKYEKRIKQFFNSH